MGDFFLVCDSSGDVTPSLTNVPEPFGAYFSREAPMK